MDCASKIEGAGPSPAGEDALLLRELAHRTGNELTVARSAVALALRADPRGARADVLREVAGRLDRVGDVARLLAAPVPAETDAGADLARLCRAVLASRPGAASTRLRLDLDEVRTDGPTARRLLLVATELLHNACRHALDGREGELRVALRGRDGAVVMSVADDGPGVGGSSAAGTGFGSGIIAELVGHAGGRMERETGETGTAVRVVLPLADRASGVLGTAERGRGRGHAADGGSARA